MPRLSPWGALGFVLVAIPGPALAHEGRRFRFESRVGYAHAWTTGQSYLGPGTGWAFGWTPKAPVHVEVGTLYHGGSVASAQGEAVRYWSRTWALLTHAAVGYEARTRMPGVRLRPQWSMGFTFVSDTMQWGPTVAQRIDPLFMTGPGMVVLVDVGPIHLGLEGRALFVPSRVAAPVGGAYGLVGTSF